MSSPVILYVGKCSKTVDLKLQLVMNSRCGG